MSQFSTPWRPGKTIEYRGLSAVIAGMARTVASIAAPILRRWPGPIFFGGLGFGVVSVWVIALLSEAFLGKHLFFRDLLVVIGVTIFMACVPLFAIWWERKVAGRIQSRCGPMRVGGWHGWAQSFADGLKLLCKEDLVPDGADKPLFRLAPYLALTPVVLAFLALPFGTYWVFRNLDVGLLLVLAMLGVEVFGVILAGWASNSKWGLFGAMREACQMVSYEIPMGLALLLPIMTVGSLDLAQVGAAQAGGWPSWLVFQGPFLFVAAGVYYVASLASCKRAPFDLPESESELVAGFHTEYSGMRWALFFFAEYAGMFVVSALAVILFFGAWYSPLPYAWALATEGHEGAGLILRRAVNGMVFSGPLWFVVKGFILVYVQLWLRWTLPRIRIDQVLYACIQVLLPLSMLLLLCHTLWQLWVAPDGILGTASNVVLALIGGAAAVYALWIIVKARWHRWRLVGNLGVELLPGS
ncbi:MAG: NADH-quinone oxidoreductase subunit NuoH [bacterium]|nr:NADH-quinone oxidoreductase subunit NuoH [bacterium]